MNPDYTPLTPPLYARIRAFAAVMSNENFQPSIPAEEASSREEMNFGDILSGFEQQHPDSVRGETVIGTVISVSTDLGLGEIPALWPALSPNLFPAFPYLAASPSRASL